MKSAASGVSAVVEADWRGNRRAEHGLRTADDSPCLEPIAGKLRRGRKSDFESLPIPKGLRPKAQGCEERATLGQRTRKTKPQRGFGFGECTPRVATPLGLFFCAPVTQGSSFLATLGFIAESRWDSRKRHSSKT